MRKEKTLNSYRARYHFDNYPEKLGIYFRNIIIHQIGEIYCGNDSVVYEHDQYCLELTYVLSGKGKVFTGKTSHDLSKGVLSFSVPGETHEIISDTIEPLRYFFFAFTTLPNHELFSVFQNIAEHPEVLKRRCFSNTDGENFQEVFIKLLSEFSSMDVFSKILIESYANELLVKALKVSDESKQFSDKQNEYYPNIDEKQYIVFKTVDYIDRNVAKINNITDVYKAVGYSASYIAHTFATYMKLSPSKYLQSAKMNRAAALLREHSITEVSDMLGYSSIHPFSRAFLKYYGKSPSKWAQEKSKKNK